jgi:hypothetical protein
VLSYGAAEECRNLSKKGSAEESERNIVIDDECVQSCGITPNLVRKCSSAFALSNILHVSNTLIQDHLPLLNVTGNCLIKLSQYQQQALGIHSK